MYLIYCHHLVLIDVYICLGLVIVYLFDCDWSVIEDVYICTRVHHVCLFYIFVLVYVLFNSGPGDPTGPDPRMKGK